MAGSSENLAGQIFNDVSPSIVKISHVSSGMSLGWWRPDSHPNGTGFVWNQDGIIVTSYSVTKFACENQVTNNKDTHDICVTLFNGEVMFAHVVAFSPYNDITILQLDGKIPNLTPIRVGGVSVHDLLVGQEVFVVGHPFDFDQSLTVGIISGLNREIYNNGIRIQDCIQVNCNINPGNCGGPLIDSSGRLIGMILSRQLYPNLQLPRTGFSISIDTVSQVVGQLLESRHCGGSNGD